MKTPLKTLAGLVVMGLLMHAPAGAQDASSRPSPRTNGQNFHILQTVKQRRTILPPDTGPLLYNGGPVMQNGVTPYVIFWVPPKLQNGTTTSMTTHYQTVQKNMLGDYSGHGIDNNNTQYYQIVSGKAKYIQNKGAAAAITYVDTNPFPASGCSDSATPGNCITDAQLEAEISRVMTLKKWTGGITKIFFVYTPIGEGSCFDSTSSSCAYTAYCAYHSAFGTVATPVIYANMPYGDPNYCQNPGTPSPNGDIPADTAATAASHELTEAITDPELNAWYTAAGSEIGDLCAYDYGPFYNWDGGNANQMWNGHFYMLQTEYDNNQLSCVQVGPGPE
jgi:hypothetical protein